MPPQLFVREAGFGMSASTVALTVLAGLSAASVLFLVASGLSLVFGALRVINMAHGSLYMIAALRTTAIVSLFAQPAIGFVLALVLAPVAVALLGALIEILVLRRLYGREHLLQLLATYALVLVFAGGVRIVFGSQNRIIRPPDFLTGGVSLGTITFPTYKFFLMFAALVVAAGLYVLLYRTNLGRNVRAAVADPELLNPSGVNVARLFTTVFMIVAVLRWAAAAVLFPLALALPPLAGLVEIVSPDSISANFTVGVLGTSALVLALWAISYNLMLGYAGMVSFAHAAYYGIGAYTVALLYQDLHWSVLPGLALSPLVVGAAGLVTGFISLRAVRLYFSLLTLAISQVGYVIAFEWYSFTGGDNGIHGISPPDFLSNPTVLYYFVAAVVAVCLLIMFGLVRSPFGAALLAIRENRLRAASIGLNVKRYELAVFTISAAFAGVAGALFAIYDNQAFPDLMKWTESAHPIVVTLLGGSGTFLGPALGAAVYIWLANSVGKSLPAPFDIVLGAIVLGIVLVAPGGLGSAREGILRVSARRTDSR